MQEYLSAVRVLDAVINDGKSLDAQFKATDSPLSKQISYGVVRDYFHLSEIVRQVVKKPLAGKNAELHLLLLAQQGVLVLVVASASKINWRRGGTRRGGTRRT